jgi:hypothetical protein
MFTYRGFSPAIGYVYHSQSWLVYGIVLPNFTQISDYYNGFEWDSIPPWIVDPPADFPP